MFPFPLCGLNFEGMLTFRMLKVHQLIRITLINNPIRPSDTNGTYQQMTFLSSAF